jgi:phospholipid/cholesterol/gamma-HCH transport system substrate-binding protein
MIMKKEFKIGLMGIIALIALFLGINFLKGKALFNISNEYYIRFANAKGLAKSSTVFVDGYEVGIVSNIIYDYNNPGNVLVEISVDPKLKLCHGTKAYLESGLMGGCTMNITPAQISDKVYNAGDTIPGTDSNGLMGKAEEIMPTVNNIANKLDTLITSLNRIVNDPNLAAILNNVEEVTEDLTKTTQHLNTIVGRDLPALAQTYNKVGENVLLITENFKTIDLQPTLASVNTTIENVNTMVSQMQNPNGTLGALMYDRGLYNSLHRTVSSADSLVTDLKAHPKRYVHFSVFGSKSK